MESNKIVVSNSVNIKEIKSQIIEIINLQLRRKETSEFYMDLLLWISNTNGYISCHKYNADEELSDEDDFYSVLELSEFHDTIINLEEDSFYDCILKILNQINRKDLIQKRSISIYETWEINDPELLVKI